MSKHYLLQHLKNFFEKSLTMPKKLEGGPFGIFQHQKIEGGPFGGIFFRKNSHNAEKTERGVLVKKPFSLSRYNMLRGKREKTLLVQFARPNDSIWDHKNSRTFKNYFGQFVWIEKK